MKSSLLNVLVFGERGGQRKLNEFKSDALVFNLAGNVVRDNQAVMQIKCF